MAVGGARIRSGPPADPMAVRRRPAGDAEWLVLPAEGRPEHVPPAWPLPRPSARERVRWAELWRKPQAVAWERFGLADQVALYVRCWCEAEKRGASMGIVAETRRLADALGLTVPGMRSMRWRLSSDEVADRRAAAPRRSSRSRLTVVAGDDAAEG